MLRYTSLKLMPWLGKLSITGPEFRDKRKHGRPKCECGRPKYECGRYVNGVQWLSRKLMCVQTQHSLEETLQFSEEAFRFAAETHHKCISESRSKSQHQFERHILYHQNAWVFPWQVWYAVVLTLEMFPWLSMGQMPHSLMPLVSNTKANLSQSLLPQLVCNQAAVKATNQFLQCNHCPCNWGSHCVIETTNLFLQCVIFSYNVLFITLAHDHQRES